MGGMGLRRAEWIGLLIVVAIVLVAPFTGSRLAMYNLTLTAIFGVVVVSLNLLLGVAGQVSFGQTTFMAVGGYGSAFLTMHLHLDPWLAIVIAALIALVLSYLIGKPLFRLRGHYLSMATFALALGIVSFANAATSITNGAMGMTGIPPLAIGSYELTDPLAFYILSWALCAISMLVVYLLVNSYIGRAWRALATGQDIAATLGIDVSVYKLKVFAVGAVLASIAGSFYVEYTTFVGPDLYDEPVIIMLYIMLFIGGRGSTLGPVVGAGIMLILPQAMAGLEQYQRLVFFVLLLILMVIRPSGLFGTVRDSRPLGAILPIWLLRYRRSEPS